MIIIERFEENIAVLEDSNTGEVVDINRTLLPKSAREGDVIELIDGKYVVNSEKTEIRRKSIIDRMRRMGLTF